MTPPTTYTYMWHIRWKYISRAIHWCEFHYVKTLLVQDMTLLVPPVVLKGPKNDENCAKTKLSQSWEGQSRNFLCKKKKKMEMPFFYNWIFKVIGSDLWPLSSELINLAQPYKRTLHKLHFYVRSVCVSVAEKKIRSVLCGQVQQKYMKNPVFGGL